MTDEEKAQVDRVYDALRTVIDPELGIDIVTLGLVYHVAMEDTAADVTFSLTTPGCPMEGIIRGGILQAVAQVEGVETVRPNLVWDPRWDPSMVEPGVL